MLACATLGGGRSEAGHCFHLFFSSLFFFFFFCYAFCFSPTSGNLPCVKICSPQYFGITRRYMQKKKIFLVIFIFFFQKKLIFKGFSIFYGQRSVMVAWATHSPWSIFSLFLSRSFAFEGGEKQWAEKEERMKKEECKVCVNNGQVR